MTDPNRTLNRTSETPLYVQIADYLRDDILRGVYPAGAPLPSESELNQTYGVSDLTSRKAVKILVGEGLATVTRGKGAYAARNAAVS